MEADQCTPIERERGVGISVGPVGVDDVVRKTAPNFFLESPDLDGIEISEAAAWRAAHGH
jgi:hypothetical protein